MGKTPTKTLLNSIASQTANTAHDKLTYMQRGVYPIARKVQVIYGNNGYSKDYRARAEAKAVQACAESQGYKVSRIKTSDNRITWAVAVCCDKHIGMELMVVGFEAWLGRKQSKRRNANEIA